jgi:hypothetical protein
MKQFSRWPAVLGTTLAMVLPFGLRAQEATSDVTPDQLVEQLGEDEFIRRQLATEALTELGLSALEAVKRGVKHSDPEIRFRARQVLRAIRHLDRQRLINTFAAGQDVQAADELPGWPEFRALAGDDEQSRSLYVEMLEAEWTFLESAFKDKSVPCNALLAERCQRLQDALRLRRTVPVGSVAAMLLAATCDQVDLGSQPHLMSFCYLRDFDRSMRAGSTKHALRALLGTLIAKDSSETLLTQRLHFALHYDLQEGVELARRILTSGHGIANVKQYAILVLAKLGESDDLKLIEAMLEDASVIASHNRVKNVRITTRVCDLALAALLYHANEEFQSYGLMPVRPHPTTLFHTTTIGFPSDEVRQKAISQWRQKHAGS